jgi:type VI secretion system Hcp family effector
MPSDILLKFIEPEIEGESKDQKHPGAVEIQSCDFGVAQEVSMQANAGLVAGGSSFEPFRFAKLFDKASPKLFQYVSSGAKLDLVRVIFRRPGEGGATNTSNEPVEFLVLDLKRVAVTFLGESGNSSSAIPMESVELNAEEQVVHYREIKDGEPQAAITKGYNVKTNEQAT